MPERKERSFPFVGDRSGLFCGWGGEGCMLSQDECWEERGGEGKEESMCVTEMRYLD